MNAVTTKPGHHLEKVKAVKQVPVCSD